MMTAAERATARAEHGAPPPSDQAAADPRPKEWPVPRSLTARALAPVPAFDLALLPDDLRWYVEDIADRMQVAPDIIAVAAMAAVAIVAANARTIYPKRFDSWRVYPVLWGAAIAPPGSMKSPALASIRKLLAKLEIEEHERYAAQEHERQAAALIAAAQAEAVKSQIKAAVKKGEPIDTAIVAAELRAQDEQAAGLRLRRLVVTDTTTEKLAMLVENGKRRCRPMIVWCDELAGLLSSFERDGREGDRAFYLTGWSVQNHTVDRVARGSHFLPDLAISIFGAMTPGPFERYVREAATGGDGADGFLQRLQLLVYPDQPKEWRLVDRSPNRTAEARALALMERLFEIDDDDEHGKPRALRFAPDAQEAFDRWIEALERRLRDPQSGLSEARAGHLSKYRSLMPAIALVCHLASGPGSEDQPVSLAATERAMAWCRYLDAHAERVYSMASDGAWLDEEIVRRIQTGKIKGAVRVRDIRRGFPRTVKTEDVECSCEVLAEQGWLVLEEVKPKVGRPSLVAHINPKGAARAPTETSTEAAA
jgi:hypothetical protein